MATKREILKEVFEHHKTVVCPDENWCDFETCEKDGTANMVYDAMDKWAIWQEQQGWVRVEDGLPDEGQVVDTCNGKSKSVRTAILHTRHGEGKFYRHFDMVDGDRVPSVYYTDITHWRYRPSPPGSTESKEAAQMVEDIPDYADNMMAEWEELEKREGKYKAALEKILRELPGNPRFALDRVIKSIAIEALKP